MSNPFQTPKFKKLLAKWNTKLEQSGHNEIEDFSHPDTPLKRWDNLRFRKVTPDQYYAKQEFFSKAREVFNTFKFESDVDKYIYERYSEGDSFYEIEANVRKLFPVKYNRKVISKIVSRINYESHSKKR